MSQLVVMINGEKYVKAPPVVENPGLLDFEYDFRDHGTLSIRAWLGNILYRLMDECESFNSKYPFGNSDWYYDLPYALVKAGAVKGEIDEDGEVIAVDDMPKAREIILGLVAEMCKPPAASEGP